MRKYTISYAFEKSCRQEAKWLADRIAKGKPSQNAKTSGPVKVLTAEERRAYAERMGWASK